MKNKIQLIFALFAVLCAGFFLVLDAKQASADTVLDFEYRQNGPLPAAQTVRVYNNTYAGGERIEHWKAQGYSSWLTVNPKCAKSSLPNPNPDNCVLASVSPGSSTEVSIRPNTSDLGTIGASTTIVFSGYDSTGSVVPGSDQYVVVNYGFAFTAVKNGPLPEARPLTLKNGTASGGEDIASWEAKDYAPWLRVEPRTGGSVAAGEEVSVTVQPNTTDINPGTYITVIHFFGKDASGSPVVNTDQRVYVKYIIKNPIIEFTAVKDSAILPDAQVTQIYSNTTPGAVQVGAWRSVAGATWISTTPASGTTNASGNTGNLSIKPTTTALPIGTHTSTITYTGYNGENAIADSQVVVDVRYTIRPLETCAIKVNAEYNGVITTPPGSAYNYTLLGPRTISSSGEKTFNEPAAPESWKIIYTSGTSAQFVGYNNQNQSCTQQGGSITFTLKFNNQSPPEPFPREAENTSLNPEVACGSIRLTWGSAPGAASYTLYRSNNANQPGTPWVTGITALTYTDLTPIVNRTYYYWIQAVNQFGSSDITDGKFNPTSGISVVPCGANFSTSTKSIIAVNGKQYRSKTCDGINQPGVVTNIKTGDTVTMKITLCNTGTLSASNVVVKDSFNGTNVTLVDRSTIQFRGGTNTLYREANNEFTFEFGAINKRCGASENCASNVATVTFDAVVTPPAESTQKLLRLRNVGLMTFSVAGKQPDNLGCVGLGTTEINPCRLDTGYIVFSNGLKSPVQEEVNP
jgi:uncharacterized repeat protein (TIGR01451 family)